MRENLSNHAYRYLLSLALATLGVGILFYHVFEKLSWVDAYYFSVITLTTVGYGDITPHTPGQKIFTTFYILIGVGIITTFVGTAARVRQERRENRHKKRASK
jgi:voltage-gated potassium channel Kch